MVARASAAVACATLLAATIGVGSWTTARALEAGLCVEVRAGLGAEIGVECSGRDVVLTVNADNRDAAVAAAEQISGVRTVTVAVPNAQESPPPATSPPVASPSPSPTLTSATPTPSATLTPTSDPVPAPDWPVVVHFGGGREDVRDRDFPALDALAEYLADDPDVTVVVAGYTSAGLDPARRTALSQRRAEAVRAYLVEQGIAEGRMSVVGRGMENPVASNETTQGRAQNRRVEIQTEGND